MTKHLTHPCASCPYRRDAPLGFWHADHYTSVLDADRDPVFGAVFQCHGDGQRPSADRSLCAGWLLDQRQRGVPSIQLRLRLKDDEIVHALNDVHSTVPMYASAREMVETNLVAIAEGASADDHPEAIVKVEKFKKKRGRR